MFGETGESIPRQRGPGQLLQTLRLLFAVLALVYASPSWTAGTQPDALERPQTLQAAGQFRAALAAWLDAARVIPANDHANQCRLMLGLGQTYISLGQYGDAIRTLERAMPRAQAAGDPVLRAAVINQLGSAYLLDSNIERGQTLILEGIAEARANGRLDLAASGGNSLGTLLAAQNAQDRAAAAFRSALEDAKQSGDRLLSAQIQTNLARLQRERGNEAASWVLAQSAQRIIEALPVSHDTLFTAISLARLYARFDPADGRLQAFRLLEAAQHDARALGDELALSYAQGYQGQLYEQIGQNDDALQATRQALSSAQRAGATELLYRWHWQLGRVLRAQQQIDQAIAAYRRAIGALQLVRADLLAGYGTRRSTFREQVGPVFLEFADLMLQSASGLNDPARREARLREVRETVEQLKGAELADYFEDDCVAALKSRTAGIEQVAQRTAVLYPIILPDRLEVLVSLPQGLEHFSSVITSQALEREVRQMRLGLERRITHGYRPHAARLFDLLVRPILSDLQAQDVHTLVFVPDGSFRTIPLAALHDGKGFLIERFAVATTPGLTLTDPKPIQREDLRILVMGLTKGVQGFPPLPNVAAELEAIEKLYQGTVLLDESFNNARVDEELTGTTYSVVHLASHGQFSSDPSQTFLLTYDGRLDMNGLEQDMAITGLRKQPVELLALSACQTAAGDDRAALGLAGVAVKAGARSALATLWFINDQSSSRLVSEFYRELADPLLSKAEALRRAQLLLIKDRFYRHPGYWSPFLLIGNWL